MNRKKALTVGLVLTTMLISSACTSTDVVGKYAKSSFKALTETNQKMITSNNGNQSWILESPEGDQFQWSKDFSKTEEDITLEIDAKPFIDAGLETTKLPQDQFKYDSTNNKLIIFSQVSSEAFTYNGEPNPSESFNQIIEKHRDLIGYHESLGHYGISVGNGNKFEWAKDMSKNDKDIVFVLNPQPLVDAGVDPDKIDGWIFTKIEDMGKELEVILKPFDLK